MNKKILDCWIFFTRDKCNCLYKTTFENHGILLARQQKTHGYAPAGMCIFSSNEVVYVEQ